nr:EAL domain-containing protein [uncultured Undibacterium sp.]
MFASFSNRMTGYFAAVLIASLGILFVLWYFGWSALGLVGASQQRLDAVMQMLSVKVDLQRDMISRELQKASGDVLLIAESAELQQAVLAQQSQQPSPQRSQRTLQGIPADLTASMQAILKRQERAYPRRFSRLMLLDPERALILANSQGTESPSTLFDTGFITQCKQVLAPCRITSWMRSDGNRELIVVREIDLTSSALLAASTSNLNPKLLREKQPAKLWLIAVLNWEQMFSADIALATGLHHQSDSTLLFDSSANLLMHFPLQRQTKNSLLDVTPGSGVEQVLLQKNHVGDEFIVVYRQLRLSTQATWNLVHSVRKVEVLSGLPEGLNVLLIAGTLITLLALNLIYLASRRLTRPLDLLADVAKKLGHGELAVRVPEMVAESREIRVLSEAFNGMADAVQNAQELLEAQVAHRSQALAWSEARHLTLFNATSNAVMVMDVDRMIDCNPAAISLFGAQDKENLLQCKPSDLSPICQKNGISSGSLAREYIFLARDQGQHSFEWMHQRLDNGDCFDAEVLLNRVELDGKTVIQASVRDISARKRVEDALHASEERHRTLVEWSPEGINVHRKSRLVYVNASAIRMLGAESADQLIGRSIRDIMHPDSHHLTQTRIKSMNDVGGRDQNFEMKFIKIDGSVIDVMGQGALIDFDGEPSIYVAWHDITASKRHAESQRIAATAFESQEGMFVTDAAWNILRTNQSFNQITGFTADDVVGAPPHFFNEQFKNEMAYSAMESSIRERGSWQGEVLDQRKNGDMFPAWINISSVTDEQGVITHYVGTFNDITLRKSAEDEIRNLAFYDPLTQLPNRRLLMDRLEQALASSNRHQRRGALLFIDLDNFKTLNDTLGHDQGDRLLQQVAERLNICTREGDTVARLGGDEFVVMLENLDEHSFDAANHAETVAIKILSELNQTYWLGVNEHHSSPSIGITLFGEKAETISEPLKRADLAMYQAKAAGRNTIRFFDPKMQAMVTQRAELEEDLRDAMMNDQFELYYQAQFSDEGRLFAAEVLIRWHHPVRGMISPAEFIPIAEDTGLIAILGYWVLNVATHQLASWASQPEFADLTIAVNVSPSQFHQKNFVDQVEDVLELTGADPRRLKLELTEGFSISNIEDVIDKMSQLKKRGVSFSLDDFGTGYSSLSYLKRLPLDQLKIDQSFVRDILIDPNDAAISKMVIVLAESLGLSVVAEGVETLAQKAFLQEQGCRAYQGYLYSKPLPLAQFEAFARHAYSA